MDIIPGVLGEAEFSLFTEATYGAFYKVMNFAIAKYLKRYLNEPDADAKIKADIQKYLGDVIVGMTMHDEMIQMGIPELVTTLSPATLLSVAATNPDIKDKLEYLYDNYNKLRVTIQPTTKEDFENFEAEIDTLLMCMQASGVATTYPNMAERFKANRFIFYKPNGKVMNTGVGILNSKHSQWMICLKGLRFKEYCDAKDIDYLKRRAF